MTEPAPLLVGWVVDVQRDFMEPDGRLYVKDLGDPSDPGAVLALPSIVEAVAWLREHAGVMVFTGDWHGPEDPEIDAEAPDPGKGTYPPHCMGRSQDPEERRGAELIPHVAPRDPLVLGVSATPVEAGEVARAALRKGRPVFVQKTRFDVFAGNPATEPFLDALQRESGASLRMVVLGVARDVCVTHAVDGFLARGMAVEVIRDATWGLGLEPEEETVARWERGGGSAVRLEALKARRAPEESG